MRVITPDFLYDSIYKNVISVNLRLDDKVVSKIKNSVENETENSKKFLNYIIKNCEIAKEQNLPMCQDTGILEIFIRIGSEIFLDFSNCDQKNIYDFLNFIVAKAYTDGYFRKSIVSALTRENTQTNTPAIIHVEYIDGDKLEIYLVPKGFGSENMSVLKMFNPTATPDEIIDFVVSKIKDAGPNPCPPMFIGIGIGGTSEKAMLIAKEAQFGLTEHKILSDEKEQKILKYMKEKILDKANELNIGPLGFGGKNTVFDVNINIFPTHIAGLPVAISFSCWCNRYKKLIF
jgi:fumarate hydratase subunit alpha